MKSANETYEGEAQVLFDDIVNHLRSQKCKAYNGINCAYRGEDNKRCAIGGILPDELYFPELEGSGVHTFWTQDLWHSNWDKAQKIGNFWDKVQKIGNFIGKSNSQLAHELQCVHDKSPIDMWETKFEKLAEFNNLKYEKVEQYTV